MVAFVSICSVGNDSLLCQILRKFEIPDFEHSQSTSFPFPDYSLAWIKHCKITGCKYSSGNGQQCREWGAPTAPRWGTARTTLPSHLLCPLLSIKKQNRASHSKLALACGKGFSGLRYKNNICFFRRQVCKTLANVSASSAPGGPRVSLGGLVCTHWPATRLLWFLLIE